MSNIAIKAENISKAYQLGEFSTGTLSRDLERTWARLRGKEDPFLKIGETNDRSSAGESNVVWSLKDINFEIEQGDAVGIVGRNGAGKSTLLKILSKVTSPTTGTIKGKGRIASLLEVGTGFHPELTGRENIYLNGAILGMRKAEIRRQFDAIVDFSGVERYIDTPVKRYSSGMYVRLAFAVAAHLESEILIVDEVLAVGDAEFQKKCLGKMGDVSAGEGKTVLFVSHNMPAIKQLCRKSILLNKGHVELFSTTSKIIDLYLTEESAHSRRNEVTFDATNTEAFFTSVMICDENGEITPIKNVDDFFIVLSFTIVESVDNLEFSFSLRNSNGINILFSSLSDFPKNNSVKLAPGNYITKTKVRNNLLLPDSYSLDLFAHVRNERNVNTYRDALKFDIVEIDSYMAPYGANAKELTSILEICEWEISSK